MTSTCFLLLLLAFRLWQQAAGRRPRVVAPAAGAAPHPRAARWAGASLAGLAAAGFVGQLGWAAGLGAGLAALMGAGCLVVALGPLRCLGAATLGALYAGCLTLELSL